MTVKPSSDGGGFVVVQTLPLRLIALAGSALAGLGCYICILYSYVFQFDRVQSVISEYCPNVINMFPTVSYTIGIWEPQRFIWLFVMFGHIPAKLFYPMLYRRFFWLITDEHYRSPCFYRVLAILTSSQIIENLALVVITVVDTNSGYLLHTAAFAVWQVAFLTNVFASTVLQYSSGATTLATNLKYTFYAKMVIAIAAPVFSVTSLISFVQYRLWCIDIGYRIFSISEYFLVGLNTIFNGLAYWDFQNLKAQMVTQRCIDDTESQSSSRSECAEHFACFVYTDTSKDSLFSKG